MNVRVSSAGRRGALVRLVRKAVQRIGGRVFGIDAAPWSSACRLADGWKLVPTYENEGFFSEVLRYCKQHDIRLIIPTNDHELPIYSRVKKQLLAERIYVAVSDSATIEITGDKQATHDLLKNNDLPTVENYERSSYCDASELEYPLIIKPRFGSASSGVHRVDDAEAFRFYFKRIPSPIVQRYLSGNEYTVKFFVDEQGQPHNIEINARFGGGYPVAHQASADFIQLLMSDASSEYVPEHRCDEWTDGVAMTRWDDAVFTTAEDVGLCA